MDDDKKQCCDCGEIFPKTEEFFYPGPNNLFWGACKPCTRAQKRRRRKERGEEYLEIGRRYSAEHRARLEPGEDAAIQRRWRRDNPDKLAVLYERKKMVTAELGLRALWRHGLSLDQRQDIREFQQYLCAICKIRIALQPESGIKKEYVDHSHITGYVRGLLCNKCNVDLGWYESLTDVINEYISNPPVSQMRLGDIIYRRTQSAHIPEIFDFQKGLCWICDRSLTLGKGGNAKVDHNHATGFVRGLLCSRCNPFLGWYEKRPDVIDGYIANPPAQLLGLAIITPKRLEDPTFDSWSSRDRK